MTKQTETVTTNRLPDGTVETRDVYYRLHSVDDEPSLIGPDGTKYWFRHGQQHRDNDLPAYIGASGHKTWYQHGKRHRVNGPAIIHASGKKEYFLHGRLYTKQEYYLKMVIDKIKSLFSK